MDLSIIRNRNFMLIVLGNFISLLGTTVQSVAFSIYILDKTGSGTQFALMLSFSVIPRIILGPFLGVLSDWFNKKKITVYLDLLSGFLVLGMFALFMLTDVNIIYIYILVLLLAIISSLYVPAAEALIPLSVDEKDLVQANSVKSILISAANFLGPLLAGIFYGIYGMKLMLFINGISFLVSGIFEIFIAYSENNTKHESGYFKRFKEDFITGIKFILNDTFIFTLIICALVTNFFLTPAFEIGYIYICKIVLKVSDFQYGLSVAIIVISTIISPLVTSKIVDKFKVEKLFYLTLLISGFMVGGLTCVSMMSVIGVFPINIIPFILNIIIIFVIVVVATIMNIILASFVQKSTPKEMLGRVYSVLETMCLAAIPAGQMLYGFLFDKTPVYVPFGITFAALVICSKYYKMFSTDKKCYHKDYTEESRI